MDYPHETTLAVYIVGFSVVFNSFARLINSLFNAYESMEFESATLVLERFVAAALGVLILFLGYGLREVVFAILIGSLLNVLTSFLLTVKKIAKPTIEIDWKFWRKLLKDAFPFGLVHLFVVIYFQMDTVMLSVMKGDAPVGWYNAAYRLVFALQILPVALVNSLFPIMSRSYISSKESLGIIIEKSFKYLFIIGFPIAVGTTVLADSIILGIYGEGFVDSIITLRILIWVAVLMFFTYLFGNVMGSIDRQGVIAKVSGINAGVNIILNFLLIPRYSYIGASTATLATEAVGFSLYLVFMSKFLQALPYQRLVAKPVISGLLMGVFVYIFKNTNLLLLVTLAIVVYVLTLCLLKAFAKEELDFFRKMAGKRLEK
jgi:O-antigen/teichoic acid export membrane protein